MPPVRCWISDPERGTNEVIMKKASPEFDAYIAKSAAFARPILKRIRTLFHRACPSIEEKIKWGFPHFEYKGMVGSMAAFKQHVSFGFWKGKLLSDPHKLFAVMGKTTWITEAKQEEARSKRLATAIEWMTQGKPRNWKYMKK